MQYIRGLSNYNDSGKSAVTFGKFDGLHKGHQKLVKKVREFGEKNKINSIVCAFDMRPLWEEKGPESAITDEWQRAADASGGSGGLSDRMSFYQGVQPDSGRRIY